MIKVTFNGGYKDFTEFHKNMSDVNLRAKALGWMIVKTEIVE